MTAVDMVFHGFLMAMRTPGLQILPRISCIFLVLSEAALEIVREDATLRESPCTSLFPADAFYEWAGGW